MANERAEYEIRLKDSFSPALKKAEGSVKDFESSFSGLAGKVAAGFSLGALAMATKSLSDMGAAAEQTRISFEILTGSKKSGNKLLDQLREYASITPYVSKDILEASKTMLSFGISQEKILPTMKMLGDVAGGDANKLKSLGLVYGQISATGRLMGQDLLQLINVGFNPLQVISQKTGMSMGVLKKKMEDGAISSELVTKAFKIATDEGGKFFNMTARQGETFAGKMSTLADKLQMIFTDSGEALNKWVTPMLDKALEIIDSPDRGKGAIESKTNTDKLQGLYQAFLDGSPIAKGLLEKSFPGFMTMGEKGGLSVNNDLIESFLNSESERRSGLKSGDYEEKLKEYKFRTYGQKFLKSSLETGLGDPNNPYASGMGRADKLSSEEMKKRFDLYQSNQTNIDKLKSDLMAVEKETSNKQGWLKYYAGAFKGKADSLGKELMDDINSSGKQKKGGHSGAGEDRLGGVKNITINVAKLIGIETNTNSLNTDPHAIGEAVKRELQTALHDASLATSH